MARRYHTVDVFTDRAFGGNPLAVVLDAEGLSTAQMQSLAREFDYAETTFVLPPADPANTARVRIFTPGGELPFAGHPNVGTAFVLAREGIADGDRLVFEEGAGLVALKLTGHGVDVVEAELTAPQTLRLLGECAVADAAACIGLPVCTVSVALHAPRVASVGLPFLFVELLDRTALAAARADLAAFERLLPRDGANGVFLHVADPRDPGVRHARMFSPLDGIGEDPATGSATAALCALLASLRPEANLEFALTVRQGETMGRPSLLRARSVKRAGRVEAVMVRGGCVPMFRGTFELAGEA